MKLNMILLPSIMYDILIAVIAEMRSGKAVEMVKSSINTSIANTTPAMGALNMAATAAVAPHATKVMVLLAFKWNSLPNCEPIADPVRVIGASKPTEPPKPTVNVLETTEE